MSKLNRREFKELLTEWKQNFINENLNEEQNLSSFFDFVKSKLPFIVTSLGPNAFDSENLELFTEDGNHRLGIFKRILSNLNEDKGIPAVILYKGQDYESLLKESGYSFVKVNKNIEKRISKESLDDIEHFVKMDYQAIFCNSLKIKDFSKTGANNHTPIINDYIKKLYEEFIKDDESKAFNTSKLINSDQNVKYDDDDDDEFQIVL